MELVTGHSGSDHVDSTDAGAMHAGIVGTGTYVLGTGGRLVATMQSANVVRIADGDLMMQGRHATIESGAYDELTIQNGTQAQKRNDLVVAHYERKTSAPYTESLDLRVIKGTPTSGSPTDPEYQEGDILAGDAVVEAPLYRITLDGITVGEPVPLFDVLLPMADLWDSVSQTQPRTLVSSQWGSVHMWSFGPVACITARWTSPANEWGDEVIATVPDGLRPPQDVDFPMYRSDRLAGQGDISLLVSAGGEVHIVGHGGGGHQGDYIVTSGCWVAARSS